MRPSKIIPSLLLTALLAACQKEPVDPLADGLLAPQTDIGWSPNDPLMPTGNSTTDTENLQAALHDSRLDAGGTLYLGPGVFKVHGFIGRQNYSDPSHPSYSTVPFNGTIQGAGKGVTIIKGVRQPDGSQFEPLTYPFFEFWSDDHTLLAVVQTYLGVKDLTFDSEPGLVDYSNEYDAAGNPTGNTFPGNFSGTNGLVAYVGAGSFEYALNQLMGTDVINVHFKGSVDSQGDPETVHLFQLWGDRGGVHNVANCEFDNGLAPFEFIDLADATINVGGRPKDQVTITNTLGPGFEVQRCGDCTVNVSRLETHDAAGVYFFPGFSNTHSSLTVSHSDIRTKPGSDWAGVELWGRSGDMSVVIANNKIHSEDTFLWGPIFSDGAMQSGAVTNNKITGRGPAAMYLEVYYWYPGSATLVGNNLDGWETTPDPWWLGTAAIWLGPFMVNSVVVGGDNNVNIFDEPAYDTNWTPLYDEDGNPLTIPGYGDLIPPEEFGNLVPKENTFTGVNNAHVNVGQDVRAAMQQKVAAKEAVMSTGGRLPR
jgi:hypothetical protein